MILASLIGHRYSPGRSLPVLLLSMLGLTVLSSIGWSLDPLFAEENHPIELTQGTLLLLACVLHGWRAARLDKISVAFLLHAGLAILMYSFFLRETDIREIDADGAHFWHWVEHGARGLAGACWAIFFLLALRCLKPLWRQRYALLSSPVLVLTMLGGVLLVAGWPFDKEIFHHFIPQAVSRLIEELLELNAYLLLFAAATGDGPQPNPPKLTDIAVIPHRRTVDAE